MSAMFPEEIADYLKNNPSFFEQYADLMAQIFVPHPHGGRAVSLAERQMLTLREKNRTTESKLAELIAFGEENDAISEKVHRLAVALIAAETFQAVIHLLNFHLRDDFSVPHVAPAPVGQAGRDRRLAGIRGGQRRVAGFRRDPGRPCGGSTAGFGTASWFGEHASHIRSQALIALRNGGGTIGMIALGSEDNQRFTPTWAPLPRASRRNGFRRAGPGDQERAVTDPAANPHLAAYLAELSDQRRMSPHTISITGAIWKTAGRSGRNPLAGPAGSSHPALCRPNARAGLVRALAGAPAFGLARLSSSGSASAGWSRPTRAMASGRPNRRACCPRPCRSTKRRACWNRSRMTIRYSRRAIWPCSNCSTLPACAWPNWSPSIAMRSTP